MSQDPFTRPETAGENPSSKVDSDSTTNEDTTNLSSLPLNMPKAVVDEIESKNDVIAVDWYNRPLFPFRNLGEANLNRHFPGHVKGRLTFTNLPECGDTRHILDVNPLVEIVRDPNPTEQAEQTSKIPTAKTKTACCHLLNLLPCVCCALRMQDGDYRALCRRDPEIRNTETCIECAYARQTCTWGGFKAFEEGAILIETRESARIASNNPGGGAEVTANVFNAMQTAAAQYLAAIWSQGSIYDLINVQCIYNSSRVDGPTSSKRKKTKKRRSKRTKKLKEKGGMRIQKQTGKDVGVSQFLNQGAGLAMARNIMIREMLTYNREISESLQKSVEISKTLWEIKDISEMIQQNKKASETLQQNNEILKLLLSSPTEGK